MHIKEEFATCKQGCRYQPLCLVLTHHGLLHDACIHTYNKLIFLILLSMLASMILFNMLNITSIANTVGLLQKHSDGLVFHCIQRRKKVG
jgi:hypothetical protein